MKIAWTPITLVLLQLAGCGTTDSAPNWSPKSRPSTSATEEASYGSRQAMVEDLDRISACLRKHLAPQGLTVVVAGAESAAGAPLVGQTVPYTYANRLESRMVAVGLTPVFRVIGKSPQQWRGFLGSRMPNLVVVASLDGVSNLNNEVTKESGLTAGFGRGEGAGSIDYKVLESAKSGVAFASTVLYRPHVRATNMQDANYLGMSRGESTVKFWALAANRDFAADVFVFSGGVATRQSKIFGPVEASVGAIEWALLDAVANMLGLTLGKACDPGTTVSFNFGTLKGTTFALQAAKVGSTPQHGGQPQEDNCESVKGMAGCQLTRVGTRLLKAGLRRGDIVLSAQKATGPARAVNTTADLKTAVQLGLDLMVRPAISTKGGQEVRRVRVQT